MSTKPRKFWRFAAVIAAGAALAGCDVLAPQDPSGDATLRVGAQVAARVNGTPIYVSDVELEAAQQGLIEPGDPLDTTSPEFDNTLDELIDQRLLSLEAERRSLHKLEMSRRRINAARERILGNILVEHMVDQAITDEKIEQLYREQARIVRLGEEVRARHILFATEEQADAVYREARAGADFAALAFTHSKDEMSRYEGGDLGYVTRDVLEPSLAEVAFELKQGDISEPFQSDLGWHIVKVEDRRKEKPPSLEEMRPQIVRYLTFDEIKDVLKELRAKADIQRVDTNAAETLAPADARVRMDGDEVLPPAGADRTGAEAGGAG